MQSKKPSKPKRRLKNWIQSYIEYTSVSEAPDAFHVWTGISTIAAVLQRKVWIDEHIFQWTPNFYIVFVGPAGVVTKSTTVRLGADLLKEIPGVVFGPNSLTWNALTESLQEAQKAVPTEKGNMESDLLVMSCVTCSVGELGTFLDPGDRKMVDVFTDLWDGQLTTWEHSTKTQGSTKIINPWLNIIAATTPTWLKENFSDGLIGGGLTSRIVFVYGSDKRKYIPYPSLLKKKNEHDKLRADLVHDLGRMNEMLGEYTLTEEARAWGIAWYERHWSERPEHLASERFEGYIARKQTHLHKLAIVLAASKRDELKVTLTDLQSADGMVTLLERDMLKVFESIGASEESKNLYTIMNYLYQANGVMDQQQIYALVHNTMAVKDFAEAIDAGVQAQYLQVIGGSGGVRLKALKYPSVLSRKTT